MAKHRVNPLEENNRGTVTARERYGNLRDEDGALPPLDMSEPQPLSGPPGSPLDVDYCADPTYNDVRNDWKRGNGEKPDFDRGNAWRGNTRLRK
jgi:hypothetical protein